ncbi:MAG: patatin-like phospholipase family protein [Bacteroidales bacterium]|nr:patatin-like phospholipase family protein [Bacteroidales bacterium]
MKKIFSTILCLTFCHTIFAEGRAISRSDTIRFGPERPKIGLVLSGGGAKGIAHVGTLALLEELNIPIDYIGGTSMGAVIGSLYAMGYTADQIDMIIRTTDWTSLFNDFPKREHVGVHEKINNDPYQLRLALTPREISIFAKGAIEGQQIDNMLTNFLFEAYKTPNFSDLEIPFFAVGTDLIEAQYVILDSGNLAQAVRASMSVPTVFSPVEIDGKLLVDGGVMNNFPALAMRQKGADIIIGVDVGYQYKCMSELQNFANVFEQTMFLGGQELQQRNAEETDIVIVPDMTGLGSFQFARYAALLDRGYSAAEKARPELEKLSERLQQYDPKTTVREPYIPQRTLVLDTIILNDNKKYSDGYILSRLQLRTHRPVEIKDIDEAVQRLYGSLSFTKITYYFTESPLGSTHISLHINLHEAPSNTAKLGFRYDNIRGPSLLAGITMKSPKNLNSEFNANLDLSKYPIIDLEYRFTPEIIRKTSLWQPTLFVAYSFNNFNVYEYNLATDGMGRILVNRTREDVVVGHRGSVGAEINVKSNVIGIGVFFDHSVSRLHVGQDAGETQKITYWYPKFYYTRNSFNKKFYPTGGSIINAKFRWLHALQPDTEGIEWVRTFLTYYTDIQYAVSLSRRLTVYPSAMIAGTFVFKAEDQTGNYISPQQQFYQGGLFHISHLNQTPFVGLHLMQKFGHYGANMQINTQYEVFRNFFLTARVGALKSENNYLDMLKIRDATLGWGISASYNTTFGPIGITFQSSTKSPMSVFINFGSWL